jgi:hypothetical protein
MMQLCAAFAEHPESLVDRDIALTHDDADRDADLTVGRQE